jgi:hypothetical protein
MGDDSTWFKSRVEEDTPGDGDVLLEVGGRVKRERERERERERKWQDTIH